MRELTKEEIEHFRKNSFTFGTLREYMEKNHIPDDTLIMVERIEDRYFDGGCDISGMGGCPDTPDGIFPEGSKSTEWGVYLVKDICYGSALHWNNCIDEPEKYPGMIGKTKLTEDELKLSMNQFHPAWSFSHWKDEKLLLIHVHY